MVTCRQGALGQGGHSRVRSHQVEAARPRLAPYSITQPLLVSREGLRPPAFADVGDVKPGDCIGVSYRCSWPTNPSAIPRAAETPLRGSEKAIRIPAQMTADLALFLGCYLSEGHTTRSNWSVILTNSVDSVLYEAQRAIHRTFGLEARITHQPGRCAGLVTSSKRLVEFMDALGCGSRAANKTVPAVIAGGTREHALRFLQGAALDAYTTHTYAGKWAICLESREAIDGLQDLLTRLGIVNAQVPKFNKQVQKTYHELYAAGPWGQNLSAMVPFLEPYKLARAAEYQQLVYRTGLRRRAGGRRPRDLRCPAGREVRTHRKGHGAASIHALVRFADNRGQPRQHRQGTRGGRPVAGMARAYSGSRDPLCAGP